MIIRYLDPWGKVTFKIPVRYPLKEPYSNY